MIPFDLRIDIASGQPVISADDFAAGSVPHFVQYVSLDLRIWGIQKVAGVSSYLPTDGITLFVALGDLLQEPPTYLTQQATWTPSADLANPYLEAVLPMNTSAINTLLAGPPVLRSKQVDFGVFFFSGGSPAGSLIKRVTLYRSLYSTSSLVVPAGQTPLSAEVADATYLTHDVLGPIRLRNGTGQAAMLSIGTDGEFHADKVT
jgi:hypothetical protein